MKRRNVLVTLLAAPPALIQPTLAHGTSSIEVPTGRPRFIREGRAHRPNWLVLGTGAAPPVGWNLRPPEVEEHPVEKLPIAERLGGLFRAQVATRLRDGRLLGPPVYLNGRNLVAPYDAEVRRAAIVHQRIEWVYRFGPKALRAHPPFARAIFRGDGGVGRAHISGDGTELILLID